MEIVIHVVSKNEVEIGKIKALVIPHEDKWCHYRCNIAPPCSF
jgi:hypothetical protein